MSSGAQHIGRRPAAAADTSQRSTLNRIRRLSSGLLLDALVIDYDLDLLPVNEAYKTVVQVASGNLPLDDLTDWP